VEGCYLPLLGNRLSIHLANLSLTFLQKRSEEIPTLGDDISFDQT